MKPLSNSAQHVDITTTMPTYTDARVHEQRGPLDLPPSIRAIQNESLFL